MSSFFPSSLVIKKVTLTDDDVHPIVNTDIPFYACDFQCQTNALKLGAAGSVDFILFPNETYWTYNANLRDFQFKNSAAGSNTTLVIIATVPNAYVEKAIKGGFKQWG